MKNLIINNPYRILGVYVGDSPAAEQKNLARFRAFEKVGQNYELSLNGEEGLPKIQRSEKKANEAIQQLSLPADRIKYSLLWFSDGKTEWGRTLNAAVKSLIDGNFHNAIIEYNKLLTSQALREEYVSAVTHGLGKISQEELADILAKYFHNDNGYRDYLFSSTSIPTCFLSKWIFRGLLEEYSKESVRMIELVISMGGDQSKFYEANEELKQVYAKIQKPLSVCRSIFGEESVEYQEFALKVAKQAYQDGQVLVFETGRFLWNPKERDADGVYKQYRTDMPRRAIDECMRLIKEINDELDKFISSLKLNPTSVAILYQDREFYNKVFKTEYVTDEEVLRKANLHFKIKRSISVGIWLAVLLTIIFLNLR